jgi:histidyl-tRNA synthetase
MSDQAGAPRAPTGTHDVLFPESSRWEALLARFAGRVEAAGYGLVHTPLFEDVRVFRRGIGEGSDVVGKEMYEFTDRGGRELALRPEGTAPVVRAWVQHRPPLPWKAWYATPAFRYERPQAGRYRQHHQVGVEVLGTPDPDLDVEVVALADGFFRDLGLARFDLRINSMGDTTCRPGYLDLLRTYLRDRADALCGEHRGRFESNPLRVLDCKRPECVAATADAPALVDHLCDACRAHDARVREGLAALDVPSVQDDRLVRGFDYYTRTTFEFASSALDGAQNAIGGGGRYDGLVEMLGGPPTPGIGVGIGIERLLLTAALRAAGLRADRSFDGRSMKAQLKVADRSGARLAAIVGPDEAAAGTVSLRPLRRPGEQVVVAESDLPAAVRSLADHEPTISAPPGKDRP